MLSARIQSTVYRNDGAGDIAGLVRGQKLYEVHDLLGRIIAERGNPIFGYYLSCLRIRDLRPEFSNYRERQKKVAGVKKPNYP